MTTQATPEGDEARITCGRMQADLRMSTSQHEVGAAVSSRFLLAGFVYSPLLNRNGATSETPGGLSTENGIGRQTARAESPTRAVSSPLSTPSPIRAEMREAIPWPTSC